MRPNRASRAMTPESGRRDTPAGRRWLSGRLARGLMIPSSLPLMGTRRLALLLGLVIVAAACQGPTGAAPSQEASGPVPSPVPSIPPAVPSTSAATPQPSTESIPPAAQSPSPSGTPPPTDTPSRSPEIRFSTAGGRTDFTRTSIDLSEIDSGGPPRDGIPPIDKPQFESVDEARGWLSDLSPVIALAIGGDVRAYPIAILIWHEIVNDTAGGKPVVVTFCPLCNTAIVFERTLAGTTYDFGTTGNLRRSDLVMWDRQTESWWQQATGQAIVGSLTGAQLTFIPAQMISLGDFAKAYPTAKVLSRDTGFGRRYGINPYPGYDDSGSTPFLFDGVVDGRLAPKERVVAVSIGSEATAFPYSELRRAYLAQATVGGTPILVMWASGTASPLDRDDVLGRNIGAAGVFDRRIGGRTLTFHDDGRAGAVDDQTASRWSITGQAIDGTLAGQQLTPIVHTDPFWFAWAAFEPSTTIWTASQ